MSVIEVNKLTKDYGHGRGVFDVSLEVAPGETLGFLGPNGAGKSTTMRHLMGFSVPQSGSVTINGLDCSRKHKDILMNVGYLPGEVALPNLFIDAVPLGMLYTGPGGSRGDGGIGRIIDGIACEYKVRIYVEADIIVRQNFMRQDFGIA